MHFQRIMIGVIATIGLISSILPWYYMNLGVNFPLFTSKNPFSNGINATALQQGWVIMLCYLVTMFIVFFTKPTSQKLDRQKTKWILISSGISAALTLYSMIQVSNVFFMMKMTFGLGLYLSIAASAAILSLGYFHWKKSFSEPDISEGNSEG